MSRMRMQLGPKRRRGAEASRYDEAVSERQKPTMQPEALKAEQPIDLLKLLGTYCLE